MVLQEARRAFSRSLLPRASILSRPSSTAAAPLADLAESSFEAPIPTADEAQSFDPIEISRKRPHQLPPSRYKFRPPKYYRGPFHPHQPPPPTDISSRAFVPGPFSFPRLQETYQATIASDILALTYNHIPPGTPKPEPKPRIRPWPGDSPYLANRSSRGPRGRAVLLPIHKPITFRNIPELERVTIHSHVPKAATNSAYLHVASIVLQSITNVRATVHRSKKSVTEWEAKKDRWTSVTASMEGEDMYHFLAKLVELVMPRLKDWKGISGASGDSTGNISFGFGPEAVALFPEIEVNYDMYPPEMIPGCHITVKTSAKTDREARLLLGCFGVPFSGKMKH